MPYISASDHPAAPDRRRPRARAARQGGEAGRKKITQYTRYGTIVLLGVQAMGIANGLERMRSPEVMAIVPTPGWGFRLLDDGSR